VFEFDQHSFRRAHIGLSIWTAPTRGEAHGARRLIRDAQKGDAVAAFAHPTGFLCGGVRPSIASVVLDIFGRPAAERRLIICTGPCCDRLGHASAHLDALRARLAAGSLAVDGSNIGAASCVRRSCLGKCTGEPLAVVKPDNVWYHDLSSENLLRIYEQHVLNRQKVEALVFAEGAED
jgi:(2Fe-2S) ferredoxin